MQILNNPVIKRILNIDMHEGISVKKATTDTLWIFVEKCLRILIAFFVTPMVTNYLGLTNYGIYTYVTTYYNMFAVFVELGLASAIVKEFVKHKNNPEVQGTLFTLKVFGSIFASLGMFVVALIFGKGNENLLLFMGIASLKFVFLSIGNVDLFLQSESRFKNTSIVRNIAYVLITIFQIVAILLKWPLIYFISAFVAETLLIEIGMVITYRREGNKLRLWRFDFNYLKYIFKEYYPIILTSLASVLSLRLSQVMIGELINKDSLGIYSVAVKLTEIWYFAITSINVVLIPILIGKKETGDRKYPKYMQRMIDIMTWAGFGITLLVILSTQIFLRVLYDPIYWDAGKYVLIYAFNALTSAQAVATSTWYLSENLQKQGMYLSLIGIVISFVTNWFLIKALGVYGAALATIVTSSLILYVIPLFIKKTRPVTIMLFKSFNIFNIIKDIRSIIKQNRDIN